MDKPDSEPTISNLIMFPDGSRKTEAERLIYELVDAMYAFGSDERERKKSISMDKIYDYVDRNPAH